MSIPSGFGLAGIIGMPVAHSRSPVIHNYWLNAHGIRGAYVPLAVAPERLKDALPGLVALGFRGCNVTMPHKQTAMALLTGSTKPPNVSAPSTPSSSKQTAR